MQQRARARPGSGGAPLETAVRQVGAPRGGRIAGPAHRARPAATAAALLAAARADAPAPRPIDPRAMVLGAPGEGVSRSALPNPAEHPAPPDALVIIDGATSPTELDEALARLTPEPSPEVGRAQVIVTGSSDAFCRFGPAVEIGPLAPQEIIRSLEPSLATVTCEETPFTRRDLAAQNLLAEAYEETGRMRGAIDLYARSLAQCEATFGMDDPATLEARFTLAGAYAIAGRLSEANAIAERAASEQERVLGAEHPDTLTTKALLAGIYEGGGRLESAIMLYQETLAGRQRSLGADHRTTLVSRSTLAGAYESAGRIDEAIAEYETTLSGRERTLGPDHPRP